MMKDQKGSDVSFSNIGIGTYEPSDHPDEDVDVIVAVAPLDEDLVSQPFYDAKSNLDDLAARSDGSFSPFASKTSGSPDSPRRPSDVGSIPLKPLVSKVS
jgi:hypothetical protein